MAAASASVAKPAAGSLRGDARQQVHHGEIGERRVAGDALRKLEAFGEALRRSRPDNAKARCAWPSSALSVRPVSIISITRDGADQRRQPHRAAAADIDAAAGFRQRVERRALRDADVGRGGKFEPAADHRAVQHGDDRHLAELDALEGAMPGARMLDAGEHVALGQLGQIEAGAEMLAVAGEHDGADAVGQREKNASMPATVGSSSALRFSARASVSTATLPRRSARSVGGSLAKLGVRAGVLILILRSGAI